MEGPLNAFALLVDTLVSFSPEIAPLFSKADLQNRRDGIRIADGYSYFFFQPIPILDAGETQESVLFPRWMDQIQESEEPTRDEPMLSTNATKLPEKGRWFFSPSNMVVGVLQLLTSRDTRSMASRTSAEEAKEVPGPMMYTES